MTELTKKHVAQILLNNLKKANENLAKEKEWYERNSVMPLNDALELYFKTTLKYNNKLIESIKKEYKDLE